MATQTPNLGLIKPGRGEYTGTWDIPMNKNLSAIDAAVGEINSEIETARGTQGSLNDRISGSINTDGTLKDTPEIAAARVSPVYGADDGAGNDYTLTQRIEKGDREVYDARTGLGTLSDAFAFHADDDVHNSVISAPTGFFQFTGANIIVNGSVEPVVCNINGYRQVVRTSKQATIAGAAGTYYVYLEKGPGDTIVNRIAVGQNSGSVSLYTVNNTISQFTDTTQNFLTSGVQAGDILEITSTGSANKGQYVVKSIVDANNLLIVGRFPTIQTSVLNYKITNPLAPSIGYASIAHAKRFARVSGRIYIGRAVFDGAQVTSTTMYAKKGRYEEFHFVTLTGGFFSSTVSHNIGYVPTRIQCFASRANDYTLPLEPLSVAADSIDGTGVLQRSVIIQLSDMTLKVRNTTSNIFYVDFDGVTWTQGYLLIVAER